ncbi:hypothetical protein [Flavobacterium sp. 9]|uniref:hypothetical protein n=1 Tax=Flavobacterium sp. 9 TaxID=2035198 RepID=UPI0018EB0ECE|nr:hypothetical protein [Flavobacterium sp. 9]
MPEYFQLPLYFFSPGAKGSSDIWLEISILLIFTSDLVTKTTGFRASKSTKNGTPISIFKLQKSPVL